MSVLAMIGFFCAVSLLLGVAVGKVLKRLGESDDLRQRIADGKLTCNECGHVFADVPGELVFFHTMDGEWLCQDCYGPLAKREARRR